MSDQTVYLTFGTCPICGKYIGDAKEPPGSMIMGIPVPGTMQEIRHYHVDCMAKIGEILLDEFGFPLFFDPGGNPENDPQRHPFCGPGCGCAKTADWYERTKLSNWVEPIQPYQWAMLDFIAGKGRLMGPSERWNKYVQEMRYLLKDAPPNDPV